MKEISEKLNKWFDDYLAQAKMQPDYQDGWVPTSIGMALKTQEGLRQQSFLQCLLERDRIKL